MSKDMKRFIGTVTLRNDHNVYETTTNYIIESPIGESGQINSREYPKNKINIIRNYLRGSELSVDGAAKRMEKSPYDKLLQFQYGPRRNGEIQDILVCLVAIGKGTLSIDNVNYFYKIL
jgi:hypothetical protein